MTMTIIPTSTVKRSSANISAMQPGTKGDRTCLCEGEVMVMFGAFGLIMCYEDIDYTDIEKTCGRISVHEADVVNGEPLMKGDRVSFYLYADEQGLGAEVCTLEQRASAQDLTGSCNILRGLGAAILAALKDEEDELGSLEDNLSCPTSHDLDKSCVLLRGLGATILTAINEESDALGPIVDSISYPEFASATDSALLSDSEGQDEAIIASSDDVSDTDSDQDAKSPISTVGDDSTSAGAESDSNEERGEYAMPWADVHAKLSGVLVNAVESDDEDVMPWADFHTRVSKQLATAMASDDEDAEPWAAVNGRIARGIATAMASDDEDANPWAVVNGRIARGLAKSMVTDYEDATPWADVRGRIARGLANAMPSEDEDANPWAVVNGRIARGFANAMASDDADATPWADVNGRIAKGIAIAMSSDDADAKPWTDVNGRIARGIANAMVSDEEASEDDSCSLGDVSDCSGIDGDVESNDGDNESIENLSLSTWRHDEDDAWRHGLDEVVLSAPPAASSDEESTSVGAGSDSQAEYLPWPTLTRFVAKIGPVTGEPEGLSLCACPPGLRAPPGLSLPGL